MLWKLIFITCVILATVLILSKKFVSKTIIYHVKEKKINYSIMKETDVKECLKYEIILDHIKKKIKLRNIDNLMNNLLFDIKTGTRISFDGRYYKYNIKDNLYEFLEEC